MPNPRKAMENTMAMTYKEIFNVLKNIDGSTRIFIKCGEYEDYGNHIIEGIGKEEANEDLSSVFAVKSYIYENIHAEYGEEALFFSYFNYSNSGMHIRSISIISEREITSDTETREEVVVLNTY